MAIYSGARARLIPPGTNDPRITPVGVILHVDSGNSGSLYDYFKNKSGGIESHFFIRKDGVVEQYRDTAFEADANFHGNSFQQNGKTVGFISVETQGLDVGEWNDLQLAEIKKLILWAHSTHGVPIRRCPAWNEGGIGYHTMWGAPGPWTPVAKNCPGPDRIKQFNNILVPWFKTATIPPKPVTPPAVEDDMPYTEDQLRAIIRSENEKYGTRLWGAPTGTGTHLIAAVAALSKAVAAIGTQIATTDKVNDQQFTNAMTDLKDALQRLETTAGSDPTSE